MAWGNNSNSGGSNNYGNRGPRNSQSTYATIGAFWPSKSRNNMFSGNLDILGKDAETGQKLEDIFRDAIANNQKISITMFANEDTSNNRPTFSLSINLEKPYVEAKGNDRR